LNETVNKLWEDYPPTFVNTYYETETALTGIAAGFKDDNDTSYEAFSAAIDDLTSSVVHSLFESYGFENGVSENTSANLTATDQLYADAATIELVVSGTAAIVSILR
jgi:hypothetical protein